LKLPPFDETTGDRSWVNFKARLLDALSRHDARYVRSILDPKIRNTTDTDGIAEFLKLWEPQSASSALWSELPKVLFLGAVVVKQNNAATEYCGPYVYYKWPDQAPDQESGAIIANDVLLKAKPSAQSDTLQTLAYDVVRVLDWGVDDESKGAAQQWVRIEVQSHAGYVPAEQIRSPIEYRACFRDTPAGWRMTALEDGE
jgi:hypothetical protein